MTYDLNDVVFAQGWIAGQIDDVVQRLTNEEQPVVAAQVEEQWKIVDTAMDELIKENRELNIKLFNARNALA